MHNHLSGNFLNLTVARGVSELRVTAFSCRPWAQMASFPIPMSVFTASLNQCTLALEQFSPPSLLGDSKDETRNQEKISQADSRIGRRLSSSTSRRGHATFVRQEI
ncbi:hypothetical protein E1B28_011839 [Marasmius oreades]|uniref:Uncharacterized protein n=1 Tax=Marasmius oreades TaxID=181124 RepID=A0A9P7RV46_9AGAR|nr:uncharacterized protein E1B28_011839 [Marasmius oreades]KAG7090240.1 hypothetical protein E1B28_011839 [Marasmius oreades]